MLRTQQRRQQQQKMFSIEIERLWKAWNVSDEMCKAFGDFKQMLNHQPSLSVSIKDKKAISQFL